MYDAPAATPMGEYRRKHTKMVKLEGKQDRLRERRDALRETLRDCPDRDKRMEIRLELDGLRFDLDQLHTEILGIWQDR